MATRGAGRTRSWTFILYPESCEKEWQSILDDLHMMYVISPLHDKDINPTGEPKKPHWHILLLFDSVKDYEQVLTISQAVGGTIPQKCISARSLVRYMAHLDNPEKAQYNISEIVGRGGADVSDLLKPSNSERYELIDEMIQYILDNNVNEYYELVMFARTHHRDDWYPLLIDSCTFFINNFIKSRRHGTLEFYQFDYETQIDIDTGEVYES